MADSDKQKGVLNVSKFPHGSSTPRAEKWRSWWAKVKAAFGSKFPLLATLLDQIPDPSQDYYGFTWHSIYDFATMDEAQTLQLLKEYTMGQYALYHTLTENFDEKQKQVIESHASDTLTNTLKTRYTWPVGHHNIAWLPFGIMCAQALGKEYADSGVTDAIAKHTNFEKAKPFNTDDVDSWSAKLRHAWTSWQNAVSDPSHMAAVQILKGILDCPDTDWKSWAFQFSIAQGNSPYTVEGLLDKVQQQDKLHRSGNKQKPSALLANGVRKPGFKNKRTKTGGVCREKGCTRKTTGNFKFCDDCFAVRRARTNNELADVPAKVRDAARNKKMQQLRSKMAQLNKKEKQAFIAEFTSADHASDEDEEPKKKSKKVKKTVRVEANVAEVLSAVPSAPSTTEDATIPRTKKKNATMIGPLGFKASMALKKSARKVTTGKAKGTALLASSWLDGCTVQKFAGCSLPPHFKRK